MAADLHMGELVDADGEFVAVLAVGGSLTLRPPNNDPDDPDRLVLDDVDSLAELAVAVATALEQRAVAIAVGHVAGGDVDGPAAVRRATDAARRLGYAGEALARL